MVFYKAVGITFVIFNLAATLWFANSLLLDFQPIASWGSLLTAGGTLAALYFGVRAITRENDVRRRKLRASRAVLALALGQVCDYTEQCADVLRSGYPFDKIGRDFPPGTKIPPIPDILLNVVKECAEHADQRDVESLAKLATNTQIQNPRLRSLLSADAVYVIKHEFDSRLIDAVELHALVGSIFDYARGRTEHIEGQPSIFASVIFLKLSEDQLPSTFELLRARGLLDI